MHFPSTIGDTLALGYPQQDLGNPNEPGEPGPPEHLAHLLHGIHDYLLFCHLQRQEPSPDLRRQRSSPQQRCAPTIKLVSAAA